MNQLEQAKDTLKEGGIIIFPTETVFGIGCLLKFPQSVKKLYKIKKRPRNQPTLALFANLDQAKEFVEFNNQALKLAEAFWPGPLTICLPVKKNLPAEILGPGNSLAIRVPSFPWLLKLLKTLNSPLLAPSANKRGEAPPSSLSQIDKELLNLVDYVVEIEPGGKNPSTIVSFTRDVLKVIREGSIKSLEVKKILTKGV